MRRKRKELCVTKPFRVFDPVRPEQMESLYQIIKKFQIIDPFTTRLLIWLLSKTCYLAQSLRTLIPLEHKKYGDVVFDDIRRLTKLWHINQILACMGSLFQVYCTFDDLQGHTVQISIKQEDPDAGLVEFKLDEIQAVVL